MNQKKLIIGLFFIATLCSCDKVLEDFPMEVHEPEIVFNAFLQPDSAFRFTISKTAMRNNPLDNPFILNPSEISLKHNSQTLDYQTLTNGQYLVSGVQVKQGDEFSVSVSANGMAPVSSKITIPDSVSFEITNISITSEKEMNCPDCPAEQRVFMTLKLDEPSDSNYYAISVFTSKKFTNYYFIDGNYIEKDTLINNASMYIESNSGIYEFYKDYGLYSNTDITSETFGQKLFFRDNLLAGLNNSLSLSVSFNSYEFQDMDTIKLNVVLNTYNKAMYLYLRSIAAYNQYGDLPLFEPIYMFSNIRNGRGVFGAMNQSTRKATLIPEK